jgi:drug/metabolite transporter superfamily protein YnfA
MTTLFLLMLCNDREVLGPWTNPPWLQALAALIVGVLMMLSLILTLTTLLPGVNVATMAAIGGAALAVVLVWMGVVALRSRPWVVSGPENASRVPKERWTMPPAALLSRPRLSPRRHAALRALGVYMVVALVMLIVKSVGLAGG